MQVFTTISAVRAFLNALPAGKTVGFVPTMGALHQGHLSLLEFARQENDVSVCSIYVNPTQFDNKSDLAAYPRTLDADRQMLEQAGCDVLFAPTDPEMYPQPPAASIAFGDLERVMEGKHRKGHFNGVGIVVSKLFNIINPHRAYFGQKDLQQFLIINRLVKDLSFPVVLKCCPILREEDGLAMSSRNRRLTPAQRGMAVQLYQALLLARNIIVKNGSITDATRAAIDFLNAFGVFSVEYFEVADAETLDPVTEFADRPVALCIAAFLGEIRLIDNLILSPHERHM